MAQRVAEHVVRGRLFGPKRLLLVDLHGVSEFGSGEEHTLLRWEWVEAIEIDRGSVVVRGGDESIVLPSGAFGLAAKELADELEEARTYVTPTVAPSQVFVPMHYAKTNQLPEPSFDPYSRRPSYKSAAVGVRRVAESRRYS